MNTTPASDIAGTDWRETWAYLIGMQAYAYGFPAIHATKLRFGMVRQPQGVVNVPLNTFFHVPRLSDHNDQYGGSPMRDAVYSLAWLDVSREPVVIHAPDSGARYVSIQLAEFYSDLFGYAGPSVNGGRAQTALVVGPAWEGETPAGADLAAAQAVQQGVWAKPLPNWRSGTTAPELRDVLLPCAPDAPLADFRTMNAAMRENPPPARDDALLRQFARVGLGPLATTEPDQLDAATQRGLARALADGPKLLVRERRRPERRQPERRRPERRAHLLAALRPGRVAAGTGLLVNHAVRRALQPGRQPDPRHGLASAQD